jgi:hypothetical protein
MFDITELFAPTVEYTYKILGYDVVAQIWGCGGSVG